MAKCVMPEKQITHLPTSMSHAFCSTVTPKKPFIQYIIKVLQLSSLVLLQIAHKHLATVNMTILIRPSPKHCSELRYSHRQVSKRSSFIHVLSNKDRKENWSPWRYHRNKALCLVRLGFFFFPAQIRSPVFNCKVNTSAAWTSIRSCTSHLQHSTQKQIRETTPGVKTDRAAALAANVRAAVCSRDRQTVVQLWFSSADVFLRC